MHKISVLLLISSCLTSCLPVIFTAATGSTLAIAKDRSIGEAIDDAKISAAIKSELLKVNFRGMYNKIDVNVVQGRVLYTGTIASEEEAIKAVEIAWGQKGVKEVANELKVSEDSDHFDLVRYTRDAMITSQIKTQLFINRDIKFINYTVITSNDIVYLFGIARSQEELEKVAEIASTIKGVKKVVSHVKLLDEPS
jgi:osmotically-inducible protein OsmY